MGFRMSSLRLSSGLYGLVSSSIFTIGCAALATSAVHAETPLASKNLVSGVEMENFSKNVLPSDDFYRHVNGTWLEKTEIPSDQSRWGSFSVLDDMVKEQVKTIIEEAGKNPNGTTGPAK